MKKKLTKAQVKRAADNARERCSSKKKPEPEYATLKQLEYVNAKVSDLEVGDFHDLAESLEIAVEAIDEIDRSLEYALQNGVSEPVKIEIMKRLRVGIRKWTSDIFNEPPTSED